MGAIATAEACRQCGSAYFYLTTEPRGDVKRCSNCGMPNDAVLTREVRVPPQANAGPIRVTGPQPNQQVFGLAVVTGDDKPAKARK